MKTQPVQWGIAPLGLIIFFSLFASTVSQKEKTLFTKKAEHGMSPANTCRHSCHRLHSGSGLDDDHTESTGFSGTGANIDVLYHKVYWRINPDSTVKYIKGSVQTNFKTIQANVSTISFDLRSGLTIDSVTFRNAKLPAGNISHTSNVVTISLGTTLSNNFIDSLTIFYQGTPPAVSGAAQGYQRSTNSGAGNYITTLSESYEDRDWWPCKADMQDKIDSMDITVNVPWGSPAAADTFWVACNGKLIDSAISGSNRSFVFKNRYPMASYLVFVSVARYNRFHNSVNVSGTDIPVVYNLFRGKTAATYTNIVNAMDRMNPVLQAFSTKFGDYPFKNEKHGFYEGLLGASGMEHQTMSGMNTGALTSTTTLSHELAHQWFGDNVTFSTWNDLWLAEGFANYGEALAAELVPSLGLNPFSIRNSIKSSALSSSVTAWIPDGNIATSNLIWNSGYGGAVYSRGAMIVSMLRAIAGDAKFYQALSSYQTALAGKAATGNMLKDHFNTALGIDITPFFNDYVGGSGNGATAIGGKGNPVNTINWNSPVPNRLLVQVGSQAQNNGANVAYFRGPVALHIKGSLAAQDTTIYFFDWGGGNLSYAGNGLSAPVAGNKLGYNLSFTPVTVVYDDSARTMSTGTTVLTPSLNDGGFSFNAAAPASASCPAPASMNLTLGTTPNSGFVNPITLSATAGVPAGTTFSFSPNPVTPGNSSTITLTGTNTLPAGTYNVTIQGTANGTTAQTTTISFVINPGTGPAISAQPSSQSVCPGTNVIFSITSTAATSYQWQVSTDGGTTWTNIAGATAATYTITGVTASMNGTQYRSIASTSCGSTVSNAATLSVDAGVTITAQPQTVNACAGQIAQLCVTATGSNLTYQWQSTPVNCNGPWAVIAGATGPCLTTSAAVTTYYRCLVTSATCGLSAFSNCVSVIVGSPVVVAAHPANITVCAGSNATFTATGTSNQVISYQWQVSTDGGNNYTNISGATSTSYTATNVAAGMNNNRYRCVMLGGTCATPAITNAAVLTVRALPVLTLTASPFTNLSPGQTTTITAAITPGGGAATTSWQYNGTPLTVNGISYIVDAEHTGQYQVVVQESYAGGQVCTSQPAAITIEANTRQQLFLFPSPNDGRFTVSYYNASLSSEKRSVSVFDSKGAKIYQKEFIVNGAYTFLPVDLSSAARGIYYVMVTDGTGKKIAEGKVHVR